MLRFPPSDPWKGLYKFHWDLKPLLPSESTSSMKHHISPEISQGEPECFPAPPTRMLSSRPTLHSRGYSWGREVMSGPRKGSEYGKSDLVSIFQARFSNQKE